MRRAAAWRRNRRRACRAHARRTRNRWSAGTARSLRACRAARSICRSAGRAPRRWWRSCRYSSPCPRAENAAVARESAHIQHVAFVDTPDVVRNVALASEATRGGLEGREWRGFGDFSATLRGRAENPSDIDFALEAFGEPAA